MEFSFERLGEGAGSDHASHHVDAEPTKDDAAHPLGMLEHEKCSDARPHRIAKHIGALDSEMIEKPQCILGHVLRAIDRRVVELLAHPMPAIVESDHTTPSLNEKGDPTSICPIGRSVGGEAVN